MYASMCTASSLDSWRTYDINRLTYGELCAEALRDVLDYSCMKMA
jgi:hypothetical protein